LTKSQTAPTPPEGKKEKQGAQVKGSVGTNGGAERLSRTCRGWGTGDAVCLLKGRGTPRSYIKKKKKNKKEKRGEEESNKKFGIKKKVTG